MKYPWYAVSRRWFDGIHFVPFIDGVFDDLESARKVFEAIKDDGRTDYVTLDEFYEDSCNVVAEKRFKEDEQDGRQGSNDSSLGLGERSQTHAYVAGRFHK